MLVSSLRLVAVFSSTHSPLVVSFAFHCQSMSDTNSTSSDKDHSTSVCELAENIERNLSVSRLSPDIVKVDDSESSESRCSTSRSNGHKEGVSSDSVYETSRKRFSKRSRLSIRGSARLACLTSYCAKPLQYCSRITAGDCTLMYTPIFLFQTTIRCSSEI